MPNSQKEGNKRKEFKRIPFNAEHAAQAGVPS